MLALCTLRQLHLLAGVTASICMWIAKILIMQICCVFFNDKILVQFSFTNSSILYHVTVYR